MVPLLAVLLSSPVAAQPSTAGKAVPILARGPWPHLPVDQGHPPAGISQQRAIRSERELTEVAGAHALPAVTRALGVKGIDFQKQMLLAVTGPRQPLVGVSGGGPPSAPARVEVARVARDAGGQVMTVSWRLVPRGAEILTAPLAAVLVDRFDGRVEFARLPDGKEKAAAGKGVKIHARAFWPDGWKGESPPRQWVVRSYAELIDPRLDAPEPVLERMRQESLARYLKALKVKAIDFNKQMLVGASGGTQPAGARVEITRVAHGGGRLTVHWKLHPPKAGAAPAELTHPAEVVLVERFAGDIQFDPPAPKQPGRPGPRPLGRD
jgi:hypothetical protein